MKRETKGWIRDMKALCRPEHVVFCNGSRYEHDFLIAEMLERKELHELNQTRYSGGVLYWSHPSDVARTPKATIIVGDNPEDAGPTNNHAYPDDAKREGTELLYKSMQKRRVMYVVPYIMGPIDSPFARAGVLLTDSAYVVINMHLMTHVTTAAYDYTEITRGVHSIGTLDPEKRRIFHFPEENLIWSMNSGYGGNALLGKKCQGLRLASVAGHREGWYAEHMLIMGIEPPKGETFYIAAAFPSACGKTNLALLTSALPGYKIWTVSDDLAWMHPGPDGRLWAINPEAGFFAVAPGTSAQSNPKMLNAVSRNTIFTNVGLTTNGNPWWEGLEAIPPEGTIDWQGKLWRGAGDVAQKNSRFTLAASGCNFMSPEWQNPKGVPISAILVGSRRSDTLPLVFEPYTHQEAVMFGAGMRSEATAATTDVQHALKHDPFAMVDFCGYNMGDYFGHWLNMPTLVKHPPKMFCVNWFRKNSDGAYLWPGFGENMRVLEWIMARTKDAIPSMRTPIGFLPEKSSLNLKGLSISDAQWKQLMRIDPKEWAGELEAHERFFKKFEKRMPQEIWDAHRNLHARFK